jgi:hypothetical protein
VLGLQRRTLGQRGEHGRIAIDPMHDMPRSRELQRHATRADATLEDRCVASGPHLGGQSHIVFEVGRPTEVQQVVNGRLPVQ